MAIMQWSDELVVDGGPIDADHKALIGLVNQLHDRVESGEWPNELGGAIESVENYTQTHFAMEERLMKACGYPEYAAHTMLHTVLLSEFKKLKRNYEKGRIVKAEDLVELFDVWLCEHIGKTDKKLGEFLAAKQQEGLSCRVIR